MWNLLCEKRTGCLLWRRDPFLEQVAGERKGELVRECAEKSWDEVRRADKIWDQLRRCEKSLEDVRGGEKRWEGTRLADRSCGELRRVETSCEKLRWAEVRWEEMRKSQVTWEAMKAVVIRWLAEKIWERERRHEMGLDEMRWKSWEDIWRVEMSWDDEMRWDEMRWHRLRWQYVTVGCSEQFPREAAMRWDRMRWEKIQNSRDMASDSRDCFCQAQEACLSPIGTAFAPFYIGYRRFKFEISAPGLPGYCLYIFDFCI